MGHTGCASLSVPSLSFALFKLLSPTQQNLRYELVPDLFFHLKLPPSLLARCRWAQSWARPMREAGLRAEGVALRQARFVQLYNR